MNASENFRRYSPDIRHREGDRSRVEKIMVRDDGPVESGIGSTSFKMDNYLESYKKSIPNTNAGSSGKKCYLDIGGKRGISARQKDQNSTKLDEQKEFKINAGKTIKEINKDLNNYSDLLSEFQEKLDKAFANPNSNHKNSNQRPKTNDAVGLSKNQRKIENFFKKTGIRDKNHLRNNQVDSTLLDNYQNKTTVSHSNVSANIINAIAKPRTSYTNVAVNISKSFYMYNGNKSYDFNDQAPSILQNVDSHTRGANCSHPNNNKSVNSEAK
jgi:hypothetical protein